ncbi:CRISPR-associated endonuclease Cas2 [Methanobrevibacter acididurans]|jgi:CRISPR-associated protein Cas2|uniref:CRISPR-associated endonuclease Cas2 n=1 Tax=Methanobrevibacter acididurans TaxID=120963 RepID=UPI0038FC0BCE
MFVIIVYDIKVERVNKVKSYLRENIYWVQNSVFEGEITPSEYEKITKKLKEIINEEEDSIIIYKFPMEDMMERNIIGIEKAPINTIL